MKKFKSIQKNQEQLNSLLMEKWGYGSPSGNMITEATGSSGEEIVATDPESWDIIKTKSNPATGKQYGFVTSQGRNVDMTDAVTPSIPDPSDSATGTNTFTPTRTGPVSTAKSVATQTKIAGPAPTKKGKFMKEQEEMDFDDEFEPASGLAAPDVNNSAMDATLSTADAPPMMEKEGEDLTGDGKIDSDDYLAAKDKAIKANLKEQHNCKSAHPGMNHDQWSNKYR